LGFMLPGFILMFILSWFYVTYGLESTLVNALFYGLKPAVSALVILAVLRIARTALLDPWLMAISIGAFLVSYLAQASFVLVILLSGLLYFLARFPRRSEPEKSSNMSLLLPLTAAIASISAISITLPFLWSGLKAGLLTFGGAYTAIPLLQEDAVANNHWLTNAQFLDGLALGGILPAPLIIFSTFVGYVGGGPWGALAMTLGVWLPAFSFTLLGHQYLERLVHHPRWQIGLRGVMAGVVGLIAATALELSRAAIVDIPTLFLAILALLILLRWPSASAVLAGVLVPGIIGVGLKLLVG
ncbi:MAG: chromate efflux transporter, partial [Chloroflexi bacterium]|nr:chromate efflux transporter [Chloroflexota bacterium]